MARTTTTSGQTTVIFEYTAATAVSLNILSNFSQYLWEQGGYGQTDNQGLLIAFATLTNAQKLTVVDKYIKRVIHEGAKNNLVSKSIDTTRETSINDANTNLIFTN